MSSEHEYLDLEKTNDEKNYENEIEIEIRFERRPRAGGARARIGARGAARPPAAAGARGSPRSRRAERSRAPGSPAATP